jgi:hypothetical protein
MTRTGRRLADPAAKLLTAPGVIWFCLWVSGCSSRLEPLAPQGGGYRQQYNGTISGDEYAEFILPGDAGQDLTVVLMSDSGAHFAIFSPELLFESSIGASAVSRRLDADGPYRVRVFRAGGSALSGAAANFTLDVILTDGANCSNRPQSCLNSLDAPARGT